MSIEYMPEALSQLHDAKTTIKIINIEDIFFIFCIEHITPKSVLLEDDRIERYLNKLLQIVPNKQNNKIRIRVIENNMRKCLPKRRNDPITPLNVNSGYTDFRTDRVFDIVIYRCEEFLKVLCHELLHFWDHGEPTIQHNTTVLMDTLDREYYRAFDLNKDRVLLVMNESITELRATCFNLLICASSNNNAVVKRALVEEYTHSLSICSKLLWHFENDTSNWCETTHAFSYYIVKTWLLGLLLRKKSFGRIRLPKNYSPKDHYIRMTTLEFV